MSVELRIVASRRPRLLYRTLESFQENLFKNFQIRGVLVNIDPIFGSHSDLTETKEVIRNFFPQAEIYSPDTANFCEAVRRNWEKTSSDFILHLEDDWILLTSITPSILDRFADPRVAQVAFLSKEKNWDISRRGLAHYRRRNLTFMGMTLPIRRKIPGFTTSPSFVRGDFARAVSGLYDTDFDPEKQFYKGVNLPLEEYASKFVSEVYAPEGVETIKDIGREWREERRIEKDVTDAASVWYRAGKRIS